MESPRAKVILDQLETGADHQTIKKKNFASLPGTSRVVLQYLRGLPAKEFSGTLGQEKVNAMLKSVGDKCLESKHTTSSITTGSPEKKIQEPGRYLRLGKIRASNFRGLQCFGGPEFEYDFSGKTYLLTGLNGTGKSSIIGAIVWALTGQLIWDRTEPSFPPKLELGLNQKEVSSSNVVVFKKNWPSEVALPESVQGSYPEPTCWIELELVPMPTGAPILIKRELKPRTASSIVTGLPDLDPLSIELSTLMPGRVNHIKFDESSKVAEILMTISGLDRINQIGIFSKGIKGSFTRVINDKKESIKKKNNYLTDIANKIRDKMPEDLKNIYEGIGQHERNPINRVTLKQFWLKEIIQQRLSSLVDILKLESEPNEQKIEAIAKQIMVANSVLISDIPDNWAAIKNLIDAGENWTEGISRNWNKALDEVILDLNTAVKWYIAKKNTIDLQMKLEAAKLLPENTELDECLLCKQVLPKNHPLRSELKRYKDASEMASKSLTDICTTLQRRLEKIIPQKFTDISSDPLSLQIKSDFELTLRKYISDELQPLAEAAISALKETLDKWHDVIIPTLPEELNLLLRNKHEDEELYNIIRPFIKWIGDALKKIDKVIWAQSNLSSGINDLNKVLGFSGSTSDSTFIAILKRAQNVAESAKPIQEAVTMLSGVHGDIKEITTLSDEVKKAECVRDALQSLEQLSLLADTVLEEDMEQIESKLQYYYSLLYNDDKFPVRKIQPVRSGRNLAFHFWVEHRSVLVEAAPILNSSRIRALLWSYIFGLSDISKKRTNSDWLDFCVIDEPLTSLDQEHCRSFASVVFNKKSDKQYIIASHDIRWPKELQRLEDNDLKFCDVKGLAARNVVALDNWTSTVFENWSEWEKDKKNIEKGRDSIWSARVWCEEELKDLLVWASNPAYSGDTLGPLLKKLEGAYLIDTCFQQQDTKELIDALKTIETDLQNSAHGCPERSRLFQNEIYNIKRVMTKEVMPKLKSVRIIVMQRLGLMTII